MEIKTFSESAKHAMAQTAALIAQANSAEDLARITQNVVNASVEQLGRIHWKTGLTEDEKLLLHCTVGTLARAAILCTAGFQTCVTVRSQALGRLMRPDEIHKLLMEVMNTWPPEGVI